jgi:coenzyme PQQ precursor peptide PqqA
VGFSGDKNMRWEVPQAIDFRYGMEITLYIARR